MTKYETMCETYKHKQVVNQFIGDVIKELIFRGVNHDNSKIGEFEVDIFTEYTPKLANSTFYEILEQITRCDVVAVVAPPELLAEFSEICFTQNKPLIFSKSERVLIKQEDGTESKIQFKFVNWIEMETFIYKTKIFC